MQEDETSPNEEALMAPETEAERNAVQRIEDAVDKVERACRTPFASGSFAFVRQLAAMRAERLDLPGPRR